MIISPMFFVFMAPAILLGIYAQLKVKRAYSKFSRVGVSSGMSGAQAAAKMLQNQGLSIVASSTQARAHGAGAVAIEQTQGFLSDHYDPQSRVLRLSPGVYSGRSLASVGIACHEAGHAMQHARGYAPLALRSMMVPATQFGSYAWMPLVFIGAFFAMPFLIKAGLMLFSAIVVFQLVTLPVEFNASRRAKKALLDQGIISASERGGVNAVLNAAALTYVAAAVSAIMTLLYYILIFTGGSRD